MGKKPDRESSKVVLQLTLDLPIQDESFVESETTENSDGSVINFSSKLHDLKRGEIISRLSMTGVFKQVK